MLHESNIIKFRENINPTKANVVTNCNKTTTTPLPRILKKKSMNILTEHQKGATYIQKYYNLTG